MVTQALAAILLSQTAYTPKGPGLRVTLEGGKEFIITCDLQNSPKTTMQIAKLAREKFYDGQRIHRVEPWVVQWGDPVSKKGPDQPTVGEGGSGHPLPFEESSVQFVRGVVGIASEGLKKGGDSQIFILTKDALRLNGNYAALGKVTLGMQYVDEIKVNTLIKRITLIDGKFVPPPPKSRKPGG